MFWWTLGPPCNGCYIPFFVHGSRLPEIISNAGRFGKKVVRPPGAKEDEYSRDSSCWPFRQLMDKVEGDPVKSLPGYYAVRNRIVREKFDTIEKGIEAQVLRVLAKAVELRNVGREGRAHLLDELTQNCVDEVVATVEELLQEFDQADSSV